MTERPRRSPDHQRVRVEWVGLGHLHLPWTAEGREQARELARQRELELRALGWAVARGADDPGALRQVETRTGPIVGGAELLLSRSGAGHRGSGAPPRG